MSEYTSKLTILRHFPKKNSMIHMPPKPMASGGCDTTLFLCKKLTFQIKIYSQTRVYLVPFIQNFPEEIYMPPKPLAINHRLHYHYFIGKQWTFLRQNNIEIHTKTFKNLSFFYFFFRTNISHNPHKKRVYNEIFTTKETCPSP